MNDFLDSFMCIERLLAMKLVFMNMYQQLLKAILYIVYYIS